jgi:ATP-dependent Zn protease
MLQEAYDEAVRLRAQHRQTLERLATALLEHQTLEETEIVAVTGLHYPTLAPDPRPGAMA